MKALITGGAGFVGRHLTKRLLARSDQVSIVDNLLTGQHPRNWAPTRALKFYYDDVRHFMRKHLASEYDVIFHLAAVVGGRLNIEGNPLAVATDLAIDADLFNWVANAARKPKVIYFSSSAVYPIDLQRSDNAFALRESHVSFDKADVGIPDMTYGWAKLTGEFLAKHAVEKHGINVIIYRPFSGYGEDQSFDYPFPSIIRRVVNGEDPVVVWGSGEQCRDFIYIEDVIDCVFATWNGIAVGEALNIGSGDPVSFKALAIMAGAKNVQPDTSKPEGVFYRVADIRNMAYFYKPTTSLITGIEIVKQALLTKPKVSVSY